MKHLGKRLYLFSIVIFTTLFLTSCAQPDYYHTNANKDMLTENWMQQMRVNPAMWTAKADPWFFTGEPERITHYAIHSRITDAMTHITVRVPNFTHVVIHGNFQVQIVGDQERNSVAILGPNAAAREAEVEVNNDILFIHQVPNPKTHCDNVIVRIGIHNLRRLVQNGNGTIVGRTVSSDNLSVSAKGGGTILLNGNMNVASVLACDHSTVSLLGAYAPCVKVRAVGNGSINIAGRVGIQSITNLGNGTVTIVGADSDRLKITAAGHGITRVIGRVNLKNILAREYSRVYVYCVFSKTLYVKECDHACVGLMGSVDTLTVNLYDYSGFSGKDLQSNLAYVQTYNWSHANIAARTRLFATAKNNSSVYFLGSPNIVSRFTADNGTIIPIWSNTIASPPYPYHVTNSWNFKTQSSSGAYTTPYGKY